ncbi:zinc-binding dehydrogenase [Streptomyces hirsutus]
MPETEAAVVRPGTGLFVRETLQVDEQRPDENELAPPAPVGCGIQTGAGAVLNELRPGTGGSVAVCGAGAVDLFAVMAAALAPAEKIIAVAIVPSRLEPARELGATHTINGNQEDTPQRLREITGGRGVDRALESGGVPALLRQAIGCLALGHGTVAVVGAPPVGTDGTFDVNFLLSGRTIRGVTEGDSDLTAFIPALANLYRSGRLPFDHMARLYEPSRIDEAAAEATGGQVLKPVLRLAD